MIDFNAIWLISISGLLLVFVLLILVAKIFYKPIDYCEKIFSRIFPFELINHMDKGYNLYRILLFIFSGLCFSPIFSIINYNGIYSKLSVFAIVVSCVFGLAGIVFSFLHFFNPNNVKIHVYLDVAFLSLTFLCGLLTFCFDYSLIKINVNHGLDFTSKIVFGFLSILPIILLLVFCFSGKLLKWAKLENNEGVIRRPRFFPLAFLEWATSFALLIEELSFFFILLNV